MLGVAIWGAGWVSGEHLKAYLKNPNVRVVAIGSLTKEEARAKARQVGVECDVYDDLDEMLRRDDLHIVSITTPHSLHVDNLVKVAEAGKHALIEKPLATSAVELERAYEVVARTGIKTLVGFELHWNPYARMLRGLVDDGTLGDIVYLEAGYFSEQGPWWPGFKWGITKKHGGTVISVAGCHAVDWLCSFGGEVAEVFAYHTRRNRRDYEYEPTIAGLIKFKNGIVGVLSASFEVHAPYCFPIVIGGSKGAVREGKLHADRFRGQTGPIALPTIYPDTPDVTHHPFSDEIDHFIDCILKGEESFLSVRNAGRRSVEACLALDLSAETGKPVKLPLCR
jgi:predicted dehydrogenase